MPTTLIGSNTNLMNEEMQNRESSSYGMAAHNPINYGGSMPKLNDIH